MTVGLMTILEGPLRDEVLRLWRVFEVDYGSVGVQVFDHPNLTFVGAGTCDLARMLPSLEELSAELPAVELKVRGIDCFHEPDRVVYLGVELSNELAKVHRAVDDLLVRRCDGLARLYRPGSWVPHITLAMGDLTQGAFDDARERLAEYDREYVVVADRISLVQSAPQDQGYEVLGQWAVGSTGSRSGRS